MVEMPVDRNATRAGQPLEIKVEDRTVPGTVDTILPLAPRFESLRDLVPSAASAVVVVPNTDGRLRAGQTVYSPLIPRDFVADVPNSCIANTPDGNHKVQVLRNNVVRDVPIATLGRRGPRSQLRQRGVRSGRRSDRVGDARSWPTERWCGLRLRRFSLWPRETRSRRADSDAKRRDAGRAGGQAVGDLRATESRIRRRSLRRGPRWRCPIRWLVPL